MTAHVRLFAGAAESVGHTALEVDAITVGEVVAALTRAGGPGTPDVLGRCAIVVDGVRAADPETPVREGSLVDVLPPFAGG